MKFEPVAIVGHSCLLPGAHGPEQLWQLVRERRVAITPAPAARWRADRERMLSTGNCATDMGGFVDGFECIWQPADYPRVSHIDLAGLDPQFQWLLHVGRGALLDAGIEPGAGLRAGAIAGNLGYPTEALLDLAQAAYFPTIPGRKRTASNRFSTGYPVHLMCQALGLEEGGFALDAACASSLYAVRLACEWLHKGRADIMLAGGINRCDSLIIHSGFTALRALSPTGRSRPFHRHADGLIPAEGAALLVLKRLRDAERAGDRIHGVIRSVGLSNDGRASGILTPSVDGQVRAMRSAYAQSDLAPRDISFVECHATGTQAGDSVELRSMAQVFEGAEDLPIGSLKANVGHLITASGAAGIIKVLAAMRHGVLPASPNSRPLTEAFEGTPFRVPESEETWPDSASPRRAAISSFGFGGNNAHLLLEEYVPRTKYAAQPAHPQPARIAVVAMAVQAGDGTGTRDFINDLLYGGRPVAKAAQEVRLASAGLAFPPRDLESALAQQTLVLRVAREALVGVPALPAARTGVLIGIQCDAAAARSGLRLAISQQPTMQPTIFDGAAQVIGCMPNIAANRISRQYSLEGPGFSVFDEDRSGMRALEIAAEWLRSGEIDAAIAGASELAVEPVHSAAVADPPGDAAVVLVLKREADAKRDGDRILAILENQNAPPCPEIAERVRECFGNTYASSGLLNLAGSIAATQARTLPVRRPMLEDLAIETLEVSSFPDTPKLELFRGPTLDALAHALRNGVSESAGSFRLAIVALSSDLAVKREQALAFLAAGANGSAPEGVFFRDRPEAGQVAFVFTGAAAAYPGMGRDLLLALPGLTRSVNARLGNHSGYTAWIYDESAPPPSDFDQLCGSSLFCQVHAEFTRRLLRLKPDAVIGLSSGESNALFALGAWSGMVEFLKEVEDCGLYTKLLAGEAQTVRESWRKRGIEGAQWAHYRISAPRAALDAALQWEPAVHITIINAPEDFIIGGEAQACRRVADRIGQAVPLNMELLVHCPDLEPAADLWRRLHTRPTNPPSGVRFYSNAHGRAYELSSIRVAEALTAQALATVDFPRTVRQAWQDGVRIFIEHGPRNQCTQSIRATLGDLPHLAVSMDMPGRSAIRQALYCAAELWTAGVEVDFSWLADAFATEVEGDLVFPAHPPLVAPVFPATVQTMPPAPALAPLLAMPEPLAPLRPSLASSTSASTSALAVAEIHTRLSASHQSYVTELARMQSAFLEAESRLLALLNGGQSPVTAKPSISSIPSVTGQPAIRFSRQDLERLASGRISEIFGPAFSAQDEYPRQVRMPGPPMLLADRVLELTGEPNSLGRGRIVTETDVVPHAWYMQNGHMPVGIAIESGQADLLLISWLGADRLNLGRRVYRLLGCELTFHGSLPRPGETLRYDIHVDGHAQSGETRIFFFHYECVSQLGPRLTVREGQAGFFTDEELAGSAGILWSPETGEHTPDAQARLDPPVRVTRLRTFDSQRLRAFGEGRVADCFGEGFERARVHTRTPHFPAGQLQMLQRVTEFDPAGGPWKRGYLRAEWTFSPQDWFFAGHFHNDPCMPGTLMLEGCAQAMAFYLAALGFTLERDGWRFEPVPERLYRLRCRGQAIPASQLVTYEIFVRELIAGPEPTLIADVLGTVDGLKAFHCAGLGLRLVPDWPLEDRREELLAIPEPKPVAVVDGFSFGYHSLLSCALGRPSDAFGKRFARFDGPVRTPRLPGPPYHFMTRVAKAELGPHGPLGSQCEVEYDVPPDAWYFHENGYRTMPAAVFFEAVLQPCGWLDSFAGCWLRTKQDIFFRNLDGKGTVYGEVFPDTGTITTRLRLTSFSELSGTSLSSFEISCHAGDRLLFEGTSVFGDFPAGALEHQAGIPPTEEESRWFHEESHEESHEVGNEAIDIAMLPARPARGRERLRMIDRITGYWPRGGAAGLGRIRAEKDLDAGEWFFKAHFYNDPVQPGSLGIEAMLQTLQVLMIRIGLHDGIANPRFEPIAAGEPISWAYRGQVLPENRRVTVLLELLGESPGFARAAASLWVDGKKIYAISSLAMRVVAGEPDRLPPLPTHFEETLDPTRDTWLLDHCPTFTVPTLPMMSAVERLAAAAARTAPARVVTELRDVILSRWLTFPNGLLRIKTQAVGDEVTLAIWRESTRKGMSRFDVVARGRARLADSYPPPPAPLPPLVDAPLVPDPYEAGDLAHGPAFRLMSSLRRSNAGASFQLDAGISMAPTGLLHQVLLDGATHGIPNDNLRLWSDEIEEGVVGFPSRLNRLSLFGPTPLQGLIRCEVRFDGFASKSAPRFQIQWIHEDTVWASAELVYHIFPLGPIGRVPGRQRRAFLQDRLYVPDVGLGKSDNGLTTLSAQEIADLDWLPGTLRHAYALKVDRPEEIAAKQHVARVLGVHPAEVDVAEDFTSATCARFPLIAFSLHVENREDRFTVTDRQPPRLDTLPIRDFWRVTSGVENFPLIDLYLALSERFIRRIQLQDPADFASIDGRRVLYLGNHQVAIESMLFSFVVSALSGLQIQMVAKKEHARTWLGEFVDLGQRYPGARQSIPILLFDREDPASLPALLEQFRSGFSTSLMVHVEGTRALSCREPVTRVSSVFIDLAMRLDMPVIPIRFVGGLPVDPLPERIEFPFNGGQQDIVIGKAISPGHLSRLPLRKRTRAVIDAIEALHPPDEQPLDGKAGKGPLPTNMKAVLRHLMPSPEQLSGDAWREEFRTWLSSG